MSSTAGEGNDMNIQPFNITDAKETPQRSHRMQPVPAAATGRTISELISDANKLHAEIDISTTRAQDLSIKLGLMLKEAKERKPKGDTWPAFVKMHFEFSRERADELIRIANGNTTVTEVRAKTVARVKKHRSKPVLRNTGSNVVTSNGTRTEAVTDAQPITTEPVSDAEPVIKRVGAFHHELTDLLDDYCGRLQAFVENHPDLDDECRGCLMQVLELNADRLQQLAQHIDGR
jgi:hypothetical protein